MGVHFMLEIMKKIFDHHYQLQYDIEGWLINKAKEKNTYLLRFQLKNKKITVYLHTYHHIFI